VKYFGQLILSFLAVVFSTILIVSVLFSYFSVQTDRTQIQNTMETLSKSIVVMAIDDDQNGFDSNRLDQARATLSKQDIKLTVYSNQGKQVVPANTTNTVPEKAMEVIKNPEKAYRVTSVKNNNQTLTSYYQLELGQNNLGYIKVTTTSATTSPLSNPMRGQLLLAGFIAMIIALVFSIIIARSISKRIEVLRSATKEITRKNYDTKVKENNFDEIGQLGNDINEMSRSLKRQQEEIHEQEERRKTFMANASHEMRTPLTVIGGFLEALENDVIPQKDQKRYFLMMHDEVERLTRLVKDNLDYERLRSAETPLRIERFNAGEMTNKVIEQLKVKAKEKGDKLILDSDFDVPLNADRDRFTQLMVNVITNAIQFTEKGKIEVSLQNVEGIVTIKVKDTGIGMTQKDIDNIFERYYKADKSRIKTKGESGLGMAIVREILDLHQADIDIQSEVGKGTMMTITFNNANNPVPEETE
jgi:signal transduction histidine kinase